MDPIIKWVGGKRQLLPEIRRRIPDHRLYVEPFVGGGAVLFDLMPERAFVCDVNRELVNLYWVIKSSVEELVSHLSIHVLDEEYYYSVRAWDRDPNFLSVRSPVERASRFLYLNRTCFNGLWRVNPQDQNNVPFGRPKRLTLPDPEHLRAMGRYLQKHATVMHGSYELTETLAAPGTFYYFDPPYVPLSASESFVGYAKGGFGLDDQRKLAAFCDRIQKKGAGFLLSNSDCPLSREIYGWMFRLESVPARRSVGRRSDSRKSVNELLVSGNTTAVV